MEFHRKNHPVQIDQLRSILRMSPAVLPHGLPYLAGCKIIDIVCNDVLCILSLAKRILDTDRPVMNQYISLSALHIIISALLTLTYDTNTILYGMAGTKCILSPAASGLLQTPKALEARGKIEE